MKKNILAIIILLLLPYTIKAELVFISESCVEHFNVYSYFRCPMFGSFRGCMTYFTDCKIIDNKVIFDNYIFLLLCEYGKNYAVERKRWIEDHPIGIYP